MLDVVGISKSYTSFGRGQTTVLKDVSLSVAKGQSVGLVGESGSGKSTLIKCILRLTRTDAGTITYDGMDVVNADKASLRRFRREVQLIFQDPYSSLNPRMTVEELVGEGLLVHHIEDSAARRRERVAMWLERVGLRPDDMRRYPRSFSGGQRQRIAIARALAIDPRLLICDEPVSALDVSVQAQVINLLRDLQDQLGLAILFVAHDLAVVRHLCTDIAVLNEGAVVEHGPRDEVFGNPQDPYTISLLEAVPVPDPGLSHRRRSPQPAE